MSTLELKGSIYDSIAKINDSSILMQISEMTSGKADSWDELSPAQQEEIENALQETQDEKNLVPHEVVMKKYKKWLE